MRMLVEPSGALWKVLCLECCNLGDEGVLHLFRGLESQTCILKKLDLEDVRIGDAGASVLAAAALRANDTVEDLTLVGNDIGNKGISRLAEGLVGNKSIRCMNLFWNNVGPAGASVLAAALRTNDTVEDLRLVGNDIGDEGVSRLAEGLVGNQSILRMDLSYNNVGPASADALLKAVEQNTTSEHLLCDGMYTTTHSKKI